MAANRNQHVKTPGKFVFDPAGTPVAVYSKTGWTAEVVEDNVFLPSMRWGEHNQIFRGRYMKFTGTPTMFTAAALAKLYTHAAVPMGGSIVGSTDKVGTLVTTDGQKRTVACLCIYQEPAITCFPGMTLMGEVIIYGIVPLNGDGSDVDDLFDEASVSWTDADWDQLAEIAPGWSFSWPIVLPSPAASAWDDMDVKEPGFTITPKSGLMEDTSQRGLVNITINNYQVDITATVMNISQTLVLDALGRTLKPGQSKNSLGRDLILNANDGTAFIRCYNAVLQPASFTYNATDHVVGKLAWRTLPTAPSGVRGPHMLVTTVDPDA